MGRIRAGEGKFSVVGTHDYVGTQMTQTVRRSDAFGNADFHRSLKDIASFIQVKFR